MFFHFYLTLGWKTYLYLRVGRKAYSTQDENTGKAARPKPEVRVRKWVSKKVIARLHNVCERTVLSWMTDGIIPYRKLPSGTVKLNPLAVETALSNYDVDVEGLE